MKYKNIIIVLFILILLICGVIVFLLKNRNTVISNVKYFNYSYSVGYHYEANIIYKFIYKDNKYKVIIKDEGKTIGESVSYTVDEKFLKKLESILNKYEIYRWNGFHKSNKNVLDGNSFDLSIKYDNKDISSSGYMKWPRNYKLFKDEINELFGELRSVEK